jgi:outer membrane protein OmpA-like peptidoglycan-associated protein
MPNYSAALVLAVMSFSLSACKPKAPAPHTDGSAATATSSSGSNTASAATTANNLPPPQAQFDIEKVPVSNAVLPPFPYLEFPPGFLPGALFTNKKNFDSLYVITGKQLRKVEGRFESHEFFLNGGNMSEEEARRNYENLIAQMGGVKVNDVKPSDLSPALSEEATANDKKTRYTDRTSTYDAYLVRKPNQLVWIVLMSNTSSVTTLVVEEQPFKQTVSFVTADAMQNQLASTGHVALYINFDTDKASIRPDGKPAIDEIAKHLEKDPTLKLSIEGHTDNVGDPTHNKALSQQRADAVMGTLLAAGIAKERLSTVGLGDTKPVADNKDEAGRAKNRRVELVKRT